jgi:ribonuclease HII
MIEIGIDEAGRGPVIGPLVVCSVAIPKSDIEQLTDIGVKDSKDLSAKKREEIKTWFLKNCEIRGWSFSLVYCLPERIDSAVYNKGLNILETELFAESVNGLNVKTKTAVTITCDACDVDEKRFSRRVSQLIEGWPWRQSVLNSYHKADENYPIVGMASILAKQARDSAIREIEAEIGYPIGSGYPSDKKTIHAVRKMIGDKPHEQLRWSWSTVKRIWHETHNSELPKRDIKDGNQTTLF